MAGDVSNNTNTALANDMNIRTLASTDLILLSGSRIYAMLIDTANNVAFSHSVGTGTSTNQCYNL